MKKILFMSLATLGMLASCSQEEANVNSQQNENDAVIRLNMTPVATVQTRGTGTVGAVNANANKWSKQKINVYMVDRGTTTAAKSDIDGTSIYEDATFIAPNGVNEGYADAEDGSIKYYPLSGNFDFWGYRLDDAATSTTQVTETQIYRPFTMNGSQDIMVSKAQPNDDEMKLFPDPTAEKYFYSSYSARKGVQPRMTFNHLLSRLTFQVKAGDATGSNSKHVVITAIRASSLTKGNLIIADIDPAEGEAEQRIVWNTTAQSQDTLAVMSRVGTDQNTNLVAYTPDLDDDGYMKWDDNDMVSIGEALMISPTEELTVKVEGYEMLERTEGGQLEKVPFVGKLPVTGKVFETGKSYNILLTVYGRNEIILDTTLTPWGNGGEVSLGGDEIN